MAQLVTRTWGITDGPTGLLLLPFLLLLAWLTFLRLGQRTAASAEQRFCVTAVVLGILMGLVMPGSLGTTWVLGEVTATRASARGAGATTTRGAMPGLTRWAPGA